MSLEKHKLIIDIGTHAVRAAAVTSNNTIACSVHCNIQLNQLDAHKFEQDAEEIFIGVNQCITSLFNEGYEFWAAGLASQRSTVVAWNKKTGKPVYPALSWLDRRTEKEIEFGQNKELIWGESGLVLSAHYGASKMHWLEIELGETKNILIAPLMTFLLYRLVEDKPYFCDESNAHRTQLYDINRRLWSRSLSEIFHTENLFLPSLMPIVSNFGKIVNSSIPLKVAAGDQTAAFYCLRSLCKNATIRERETIFLNVGTGAFVACDYDSKSFDDISKIGFLKSVGYSDKNDISYIVEGCVNGVGLLLSKVSRKWCKENNSDEDLFYQAIEDYYANEVRGRDIPVFINAEGGLGSPYWNNDIQSVWVNFESDNKIDNTLEVAAAIIESIAFLITINIELMRRPNSQLKYIVAGGGGTRIHSLCQIIVNLSQMLMFVTSEPESTLLGVAEMIEPSDSNEYRKLECFKPEHDEMLANRFNIFKSFLEALLVARSHS